MMEKNYEVSPNLIEQVQILLKKEAGVESFNSNDHSLDNSIQSSYLNEAIVGLNSSADALRCKLCEGELLRGSESIICVYCGHAQNQDFVRQPISFKSTIAFQWLLQSLGLDGFENVGKQIEGNQLSDRGQKSFEEELSLSDLLDHQLKWAYDDDSRGFGMQNEEQDLGKRYLSLVGIDVEEILAQEIRDRDASSVTIEQPVVSKKAENEFTKISGEGSLSLFENMQSSEAASISGDTQKNESFSNWGADFQSGFPGLGHEKSANLLISDTPSSINVSTSRIEFGSNLEIAASLNSKVSNENILVGGAGKVVEPNASFGFPVNQNEQIDDDDSFDEWGDFSTSTSDKIIQSESSSTAVIGTDNSDGPVLSDPFNDFISSAVSKDTQIQNNTLRVTDDAWNTFITPSTGGNIQSQSISGKPEQHGGRDNTVLGGANDLDLLNVVQLQGGESKSIAPGTVNKLDGSFDLGNDSMGSNTPKQATKREVAHNGISADAWNEFSVLGFGKKEEQANSLELFGGKGSGTQNDSLAFDSWNEFTRSGVISDSKPTSNQISSAAWNDFSSLMVTYANQTQSSNIRTSANEAILDDNNLLSSWSDFRSSGAQVNNIVGPNDTKTNSDPFGFHKDPNSSRIIEDNFTFSSSLDFGSTTSMLKKQLHLAGAESYDDKMSSAGGGFFSALSNSNQSTNYPQNPLQCDAVTVLDGKSTCENDDSFDAWSDFTSSSDVKANHASSENVPDNKEAVKHDIFDAWSVNVSSANMEVGKDTAFTMGKLPGLNSFIPNVNSQYVGSESLMQLDLSVGMFNNQNGSAPVPFSPSEGPDMVSRTEDGGIKADGSVDRMNPGSKETVVETLISQMHDLSFMLESGLSIPEK